MNKYIKGDMIISLDELSQQEFIYHGNQVLHCGWFQNWNLRLCINMINRGCLFKAVRRESK